MKKINTYISTKKTEEKEDDERKHKSVRNSPSRRIKELCLCSKAIFCFTIFLTFFVCGFSCFFLLECCHINKIPT